MLMPWLHARVGRLLDRLWFGREFTPVEAVKHVLSGMQQATDEPSLVAATEATLSDMFRRRVVILMDDQPVPEQAMTTDIRASASAAPLRIAVVDEPGARPMLSEDLALLRSLGSVFAFMLENVRLQRKRQEQEQVAQELRLQSSRSELKALRAQINPHFLFNALNAIASLIHTDPSRADAAVEQLAEVFRYTLRRSDQEWAPLDQELAFARAYLDVEQARFGRRLRVRHRRRPRTGAGARPGAVDAAADAGRERGQARHRAGCAARAASTVRAEAADGRLTLEVSDSGPGTRPAPAGRHAAGESFGLRSVRDRLQGHFGAARLTRARRARATGPSRGSGCRSSTRPAAVSGARAMMVRAFIVDDEPPARMRLRQLLAEDGDVLVVGEAGDAIEARSAIADTRPDVVFLDIEMPETSGTELAASLPEPRPFVVFATAFDRYAVDAFAVDATDYPGQADQPRTAVRDAGARARAAVAPVRSRARSGGGLARHRPCCCRGRCPRIVGYDTAAVTCRRAASAATSS